MAFSDFDLKTAVHSFALTEDRDKDLFGVQFHPEASGEAGRRIMRNFLRLCE